MGSRACDASRLSPFPTGSLQSVRFGSKSGSRKRLSWLWSCHSERETPSKPTKPIAESLRHQLLRTPTHLSHNTHEIVVFSPVNPLIPVIVLSAHFVQ